jgi:hypothetical protein
MSNLREAAQQALEALEHGWIEKGDEVVAALRAALEQPEQDVPYAVWRQGFDAVREYKEALEQPEPATSADMAIYQAIADNYTHPPRRETEQEHSPDCALLKIPSRDCDCQKPATWAGCGKCSRAFPCNNGKAQCIRLYGDEKPVVWGCFKNGELNTKLVGTEADVDFWCESDEPGMLGMVKGPLYANPPRREWPEQAPVAWLDNVIDRVYTPEELDGESTASMIPLYTAPHRREWRGLTDEEISDIFKAEPRYHYPPICATDREFARAIEAALKERNA